MLSDETVIPHAIPCTSDGEPYVGPRPFKREDRDIFFGRYRETLELTSLIKAHPEVLMYAQSGAGKTSLIDAQLIPTLQIEEEFDVLPLARVRSRRSTAIADEKIRNIYVFNALGDLSEDQLPLVERAQMTLAEYLKRRPRPPVGPPEDADEQSEPPSPTEIQDQKELRLARAVIFDQFEEMFTLYPDRYKDRQDFFRQVVDSLEADPFLRIVFSMREDYIAELDPYVDVLPQKLSTRFRLERLRRPNALAAVTEPLNAERVANDRKFEDDTAESLVDSLLLIKVRTATGEKKEVPGEFVDPVQLQVVCQTLWEKLPPEVNVITKRHLKDYANVDEALLSYYESSLRKAIDAATVAITEAVARAEDDGAALPIAEGSVRRWVEQFLITREGKRNMVFQGEKKTGTLHNRVVTELENQHLIRVEMRGDDKWYELSHDRLIAPIKDSNQRWIRRQPLAKQKSEELEARALDWISSGKDERMLLDRADLMDAKNWRQSPEAEVIGWTTELDLLIKQSEVAIEAEDNKQLRLLASEQQARANAEHQRARQFKFGLVFASLLLLVALTTTVFAFRAEKRANRNYEQAQKAEAAANTEKDRAQKALAEERIAKAAAKAEKENAQKALADERVAEAAAKAEKERAQKALADERSAEALAKAEKEKAQNAETRAKAEAARAQDAEARAVSETLKANWKNVALTNEKYRFQSLMVSNHINELLPTDPELSLSLALAATEQWPNFSHVRYGLRSAYVTWPRKHFVLRDQGTSVENAVFTHDGQSIITTGQSVGATGTRVKVWNISDRSEQRNWPGHARRIVLVAVSHDSSRLATEGADGTGRIWWLNDGTYKELKGLTGPAAAIAFSRDDKLLATEGTIDPTKAGWAVLVWDAEDRLHLTEATPLLRLVGHQAAVTSIAFSPTDDDLATASEDTTVRVWDAKTGAHKTTLTGHTARVNSVSFDRSGRRLVTTSNDGTARIWDNLTGKELLTLRGHLGNVTKAAFSNDGKRVLTIATSKGPGSPEDNIVRIWNADSGTLLSIIAGHTNRITAASFSNNDRMIVTASEDGTAHVWEARTGAHLMSLEGNRGSISSAMFSPDDKLVLTGGTDNTAQVWRIPDDALDPQFFFARQITERGEPFGPIDIDFHSAQRIVTSGTDGWVRSWDPLTLKENVQEQIKLPRPEGVPSSRPDYLADIKRSPDGRFVAIALREDPTDPASIKAASSPHVWDSVEQKYLSLPDTLNAKPINKIEYSPKGKYLLTASKDGTAIIWNTATWKGSRLLPKPIPDVSAEVKHGQGPGFIEPGLILAAAFDDTEQWVVTGHQSGIVEVFRTDGEYIEGKPAHADSVLSVAFNREGKSVLTGSADGTVALWKFDNETLTSVNSIPHTRPVIDARFSSDNNFIVTACADNTVRVWENASGVLVAEFKTLDTPWNADLSPDNKYLAVGGLRGFGEVFTCEACRPFEDLKALAIQRKPRQLDKAEKEMLQLQSDKTKTRDDNRKNK
jgi:WD40 repeat protein